MVLKAVMNAKNKQLLGAGVIEEPEKHNCKWDIVGKEQPIIKAL